MLEGAKPLENVALFDSEMGHHQANKRLNGKALPFRPDPGTGAYGE
jgi:hypothetical protein